MDLSIIIVTWRCLRCLRACLASIYRETRGVTFEIIVVDNASGDGSQEIIRQEYPKVVFVQNERNLGFAAANNVGYRRSSADLLLFLNPDTEVTAGALENMVAHLRSDNAAGAVGARLLNTDGSLQTSCVQAYPTILNQVLDSDFLRRRFPAWRLWGARAFLSDGASKVQVISGACLMVKRKTFEKVGLFTETYFMYAEDLDLSYKINSAGYEVHHLPASRVIHHGGASASQRGMLFAHLRQRESTAGFLRRTRGAAYVFLYRIALAGMAVARMLLLALPIPGRRIIPGRTDRKVVLERWFANFRWALALKDRRAES